MLNRNQFLNPVTLYFIFGNVDVLRCIIEYHGNKWRFEDDKLITTYFCSEILRSVTVVLIKV